MEDGQQEESRRRIEEDEEEEEGLSVVEELLGLREGEEGGVEGGGGDRGWVVGEIKRKDILNALDFAFFRLDDDERGEPRVRGLSLAW